jgi:hypothetical protein
MTPPDTLLLSRHWILHSDPALGDLNDRLISRKIARIEKGLTTVCGYLRRGR